MSKMDQFIKTVHNSDRYNIENVAESVDNALTAQQMNRLEEAAQLALESLRELEPNAEVFDWGPSLEFARQRRDRAIAALELALKPRQSK
jgi:hypothetical protein